MPVIGDGCRVPHFGLLMSFYWDNLLSLAEPQRDRRRPVIACWAS
jgi:hypothetical protein